MISTSKKKFYILYSFIILLYPLFIRLKEQELDYFTQALEFIPYAAQAATAAKTVAIAFVAAQSVTAGLLSRRFPADIVYAHQKQFVYAQAFNVSGIPQEYRNYERYCNIPLSDIVADPGYEVLYAPENYVTQEQKSHRNLYVSQQLYFDKMLGLQHAFVQKSNKIHAMMYESTHGKTVKELIRARLDIMHDAHHQDHEKIYNKGAKQVYKVWFDAQGNLLPVRATAQIQVHESFEKYLEYFPVQDKDIHCLPENHLEKYGKEEYRREEMRCAELSSKTNTPYNNALALLIKLDDTQAPFSQIYDYKQQNNVILRTSDAQNLYAYIISERIAKQLQAPASLVSIKHDPLWNPSQQLSLQDQELLLLRQEYIQKRFEKLLCIEDYALTRTLFEHTPTDAAQLVDTEYSNKHIYEVMQDLVKHHPQCFHENGILLKFQNDAYVRHRIQKPLNDPQMQSIINYSLMLYRFDPNPEIREIAYNALESATQGCYETLEPEFFKMQARVEKDILQHVQPRLLKSYTSPQTQTVAFHEQAVQYFKQCDDSKIPYATQRLQAYAQAKSEQFKQSLHTFAAQPYTEKMCSAFGMLLDPFTSIFGTSLQKELAQENLAEIDLMGLIYENLSHEKTLVSDFEISLIYAQLGHKYLQRGKLDIASQCIDLIHIRTRHALSMGTGILQTALLVPKIAYALGSEFHYLYNNPQARTDLINATANLFIENVMFLQDVQALHPRALQKIAKDAATLKEIIKYTGEALYYATAEDITQWTAEQIALFTEIPFLFTKAFGKLFQASKLPQSLLPETTLAEEIKDLAIIEFENTVEQQVIGYTENTAFEKSPLLILKPENTKRGFLIKSVPEIKKQAHILKTQWDVINELLITSDEQIIKKILKNKNFIQEFAQETNAMYQFCKAKGKQILMPYIEECKPLITGINKLDFNPLSQEIIPEAFLISEAKTEEVLKHMYFAEIRAGRDKNLLNIWGGHHNFMELLLDPEFVKLHNFTEIYIEGLGKAYYVEKDIITPLGIFTAHKTYFPQECTPKQVTQFWKENLKKALPRNGREELIIKYLDAPINSKINLTYIININTESFDNILFTFREGQK